MKNLFSIVSAVAVMLLVVGATAHAATYYVPDNYATIQAALNAAASGDTITVRDGTYVGTGNKDLDFKGKALTLQSEHGPAACIIDCQGVGRGFYFHSGEGPGSVLDGFTIMNGVAPGTGLSSRGGGIRCDNGSSPTIINCVIQGCTAAGHGGGIYCVSSSPSMLKCVITGNSALNSGGGIWCYSSSPEITNCLISENSANGGGGGLHIYYNSFPTITNCTITGNSAAGGGGVDVWTYASPTLVNCILWNNSAPSGPEISLSTLYPAYITVSYSDVAGGQAAIAGDPAGVTWGAGNIVVDPLFVDVVADDYHLQPGSSAIDAGDPTYDYSNEPEPNGGRINMGAYGNTAEAAPSGLPDDDCDGVDDDYDGVPDDDYVPTPTTCGLDLCYNEGAIACIDAQEVDTCEPLPPTTVYYDADSDGHGDPASTLDVCTLPDYYVFIGDDCDDGDTGVNPEADDICGIDHIVIDKDCDPSNDGELNCDEFCGDIDMDGYVTNEQWDNWGGVIPSEICPWIVNRGDCNDNDAAVSPVADEVCDGTDNNCNGKVDEECPAVDQEEALKVVDKMSSSDPLMQEAIKAAKDALMKSLGNRHPEGDKKIIWLTAEKLAAKHGHKAYDYFKKALAKLEKTANDPLLKAEAEKALMYLEKGSKQLAEKAIEKLPPGTDKDKAQAKYDRAQAETERRKKMQDYRSAWKYANKGNPERASCIEEITVLSPAGDKVTAIGDEIEFQRTVLTDVEGNQVVIDTSCGRCLYVGQTIRGWTILEIIDDGTLAVRCGQ